MSQPHEPVLSAMHGCAVEEYLKMIETLRDGETIADRASELREDSWDGSFRL